MGHIDDVSRTLFMVTQGGIGSHSILLRSLVFPRYYVSATRMLESSEFMIGLGADDGVDEVTLPPFARSRSFRVLPPLILYQPITFVAPGANRDFLFQPISTMQDEQYAAYFIMK